MRVDAEPTVRAISQLARAVARFGGHDSVDLEVDAAELRLSPLSRSAQPVVLGEEARGLAAPAAAFLVRARRRARGGRGDPDPAACVAARAAD